MKGCFPMGSMTGAPKVEAMKAIEFYEDTARGAYSGCAGYVTPNGDFDFNGKVDGDDYFLIDRANSGPLSR